MTIRTTMDQRASWVLAIATAAIWAAVVLWRLWDHWPPDMSALYFAGHFFGTGQMEQVYASPPEFFGEGEPPAWAALRNTFTTDEDVVYPFVYPPIWAAAMAPFAKFLSPFTTFQIFYVIQVAMVAACSFLAWRIIRPEISPTTWTALILGVHVTSAITVIAIVHNQPQITAAFLSLLAMERYVSGRPVQAGAALGFAAALKLSPVFLALIFLLDRNWRAFFACALVSGGIGALSFAIAGADLHWVFLEKIQLVDSRIALMRVNWSMEVLVFQVWAAMQGVLPTFASHGGQGSVPEPAWISMVVKLGMVGALAWFVIASRQLNGRKRVAYLALGISLITTFAGPLSWSHHYLLVLVLGPLLFDLWSKPVASGLFLAFVCATSVPAMAILADMPQTGHLANLPGTFGVLLMILGFAFAPRRTADEALPEMQPAE